MSLSNPETLSHELRNDRSPDMSRRRWIIGLSMFGAAMGQIVSLYQTGIVRRLPDIPVEPFDATQVDKAPYAYKRLDTPDGLLMGISYATTTALAGAGGADRARTQPHLPLLMLAKTLYDVTTTLRLAREEWKDTRHLCGYCTAAGLASLASAALAMPEGLRAARQLSGAADSSVVQEASTR